LHSTKVELFLTSDTIASDPFFLLWLLETVLFYIDSVFGVVFASLLVTVYCIYATYLHFSSNFNNTFPRTAKWLNN